MEHYSAFWDVFIHDMEHYSAFCDLFIHDMEHYSAIVVHIDIRPSRTFEAGYMVPFATSFFSNS